DSPARGDSYSASCKWRRSVDRSRKWTNHWTLVGARISIDISSVRMGKPQALHKGGIAPGQGASTLDSGTTLVLVGAGRGTVRGKRAAVRNTTGTDTVTRGRTGSALLC